MADEENENVPMAECGACRTVIPLDSSECPECKTKFSGVSDEALGECGACNQLVPLDSTRCPECGVVFVADDVVDILRSWVNSTGINIRKLFDKFDENSDGSIDAGELKAGLLSLNLADLPPSQVDRLVQEIDADDNGVIDLDEFEVILMGDESEAVVETSEDASDADVSESGQSDAQEVPDEQPAVDEDEVDEGPEDSDETVEEADEVIEDADEDVDEEADAHDDEVEDATEEDDADDDAVEETSDEEDADDDDVGIEDEDFDLDDEDGEEDEVETVHPLQALADMMDEQEISAQRMFNELDVDGNGMISLAELKTTLAEKYGDTLDIDDVDSIMDGVDSDGDGMIDITEFIESMESLEDHDEVVAAEKPEKEFPTEWQKRMMSKTWNDSIWPIIHVGFGILIVAFLVNGMLGPVDGSGGTIAYEANERLPPTNLNLVEGDLYPCDERYQLGGCSNSLTPFAGENGASSMPKGFYWDGLLLIFLGVVGISASLFLHLIKAPSWRARAKAMKEVASDKADASEASDEEPDDEILDEEEDDEEAEVEQSDDESYEEEADDESDDEEDDEEEGEDDIDIGSHIGLMLEDEEVFGTILEFDDEEGTVTIEEDGTGDLVTGYQEDMFIE